MKCREWYDVKSVLKSEPSYYRRKSQTVEYVDTDGGAKCYSKVSAFLFRRLWENRIILRAINNA